MTTSRSMMSSRIALQLASVAAALAAASSLSAQEAEAPGAAALKSPPGIEVTPEVEALAATARARMADQADDNVVRASEAKEAFDMRAEEIAAQRHRLARALGVAEDEAGGDVSPTDVSTGNLTPVMFVSSSVPLPTLRAYAAQLDRVGGAMVFRGMPGGMQKVQPFLELSRRILLIDPGCEGASCPTYRTPILIDPVLFRHAGVEAVPAATLVSGDVFQSYCERVGEAPTLYAITYGDAHLKGHLTELARLGDGRARTVAANFDQGETR